jgi:hypothetical protein
MFVFEKVYSPLIEHCLRYIMTDPIRKYDLNFVSRFGYYCSATPSASEKGQRAWDY